MRTVHRKFIVSCLGLGLAGSVLVGCGTGFKMMPAPVAYRVSSFDPFERLRPEEEKSTFEVLYATDRKPNPKSSGAGDSYTAERGLALRLGTATVKVGGKVKSRPELERQSLSSKKRPSIELLDVTEIGRLGTTVPISERGESASDEDRDSAGAVAAEIDRQLKRTRLKNVVVYVPGINTNFETPILMMAQYGYFMLHESVFISFSWPAGSSMFGYGKQISRRAVSERNLREFLIFLAENTDAERIDLISYSAGAPVVTEALLQLRLMNSGKNSAQIHEKLKLGHVIYAGADQDLDCFRNAFLDGFDDVAESITVYVSEEDKALKMSTRFMSGIARLGHSIDHLTPGDLAALRGAEDTALVDVTRAQKLGKARDSLGHGYWYLNSWVNTDVIAILAASLNPEARGLVRSEDGALWSFPEDYPQRVESIVERRRRERVDSGS